MLGIVFIIQPWINFFQFLEGRVQCLECSHASYLAPRNHGEEKRVKFISSRIKNKSPSHFSFDTVTVLNLKSLQEHFFLFWCTKNSFSRGKRSWFKNYFKSFFRKSECILMAHPFLCNNTILFISRSGAFVFYQQQSCFAENTKLAGL